MRNPGKIVKTKSGQTGIVYDNECKNLTSGDKIPVHVLQDKPGLPSKILCEAGTLTIIGFVD